MERGVLEAEFRKLKGEVEHLNAKITNLQEDLKQRMEHQEVEKRLLKKGMVMA
jgi:TolA-binding protein